jgi:hypothetical protein
MPYQGDNRDVITGGDYALKPVMSDKKNEGSLLDLCVPDIACRYTILVLSPLSGQEHHTI